MARKKMRHFCKATIKDVARHAGVSTTTVSYFVSGRDTVCSPETAQRIREAIEILHYTPSSLTVGLRKHTTSTIGLCIERAFDPEIEFDTVYSERILRGIRHQADIVKYALLRYHSDARNTPCSDVFLDGRVDGLIFSAGHDRHAPGMVNAGMPTVIVARSHHLIDGVGGVYANEAQTMDLALSHLWELGHRRIAHLTGPVVPSLDAFPCQGRDDVAMGRLEAFVDWMKTRNCFDQTLIADAQSWHGLLHPDIISQWHRCQERPTAVVCANDVLARELMTHAAQMGWRIPEELSVVGVDNFPNAVSSLPALTTVDIPLEHLGRAAVQALIDLINELPVEQCRVCVPVTDIVIRSSTGPVARC